MVRIQEISDELLEAWPDVPAVSYCTKIIDFMVRHERTSLNFITYSTLCNACEIKRPDSELFVAIAILTASKMHFLDSRALLHFGEGKEFELEPGAVSAARQSGILIHPETGNPVPDFENHIIPFFVPSDQFWRVER